MFLTATYIYVDDDDDDDDDDDNYQWSKSLRKSNCDDHPPIRINKSNQFNINSKSIQEI
jgi:hypothetical protein